MHRERSQRERHDRTHQFVVQVITLIALGRIELQHPSCTRRRCRTVPVTARIWPRASDKRREKNQPHLYSLRPNHRDRVELATECGHRGRRGGTWRTRRKRKEEEASMWNKHRMEESRARRNTSEMRTDGARDTSKNQAVNVVFRVLEICLCVRLQKSRCGTLLEPSLVFPAIREDHQRVLPNLSQAVRCLECPRYSSWSSGHHSGTHFWAFSLLLHSRWLRRAVEYAAAPVCPHFGTEVLATQADLLNSRYRFATSVGESSVGTSGRQRRSLSVTSQSLLKWVGPPTRHSPDHSFSLIAAHYIRGPKSCGRNVKHVLATKTAIEKLPKSLHRRDILCAPSVLPTRANIRSVQCLSVHQHSSGRYKGPSALTSHKSHQHVKVSEETKKKNVETRREAHTHRAPVVSIPEDNRHHQPGEAPIRPNSMLYSVHTPQTKSVSTRA